MRGTGTRQLDLFNGLAQSKSAIDLQESVGIHCQLATGLQQFALGRIHVQGQGLGIYAIAHRQGCGQIVDQTGIAGRLVDRDLQATALHGQAINAYQPSRGSTGLQAGPLAGRIGLVTGQNQSEVGIRETQTHGIGLVALHADESADILPTDREHLGGHHTAIAQGHVLGLFLYGQLTTDLEESAHVQFKGTTGLQHFTLGRQVQGFVAQGDAHGVRATEVCRSLVVAGGVIGQCQCVGGQRDAGHARQADRAQAACQTGPLVGCVRRVREQTKYKFEACGTETHQVSRAGVQADLSRQAGARHP